MKKSRKVLLFVLGAAILVIAMAVINIKFFMPDVGEPEKINVENSAERVERGRYLANHVCVCVDCHSTRDWNKFSGPLVEGTFGQGGERFGREFGFPGNFYAKNITPAALGSWSDGEILRAISSGVNKSGKALFPLMPHPNYGKMDKEDLLSIIAYLRTLKPIEHAVPESELDFPMSLIINTIPKKAEFSHRPDPTDQVAYGAYIFNAAACNECHSKQDKGQKIEGMESAGGFEFVLPTGGIVRSSNITSDKETGIGSWSEETFVNRFKMYADSGFQVPMIEKGAFNTVMPWTMFAKMEETDLRALYAYMKTIRPIKNTVVKFSPAGAAQ